MSPGRNATYSPAPMSFTTVSERSGKRSGSAAFCRMRKRVSASAFGSAGRTAPRSAASLTIPSQFFGVRTTRWIMGSPASPRNAVTVPFAAIMNSSIRHRARFCCWTTRPMTRPSATTGSASIVSRASAPCSVRRFFIRTAASSWKRTCSRRPGVSRIARGTGPIPSSQSPTSS